MSGAPRDWAVPSGFEEVPLVDLLDRLLDHGVAVAGDLSISLAGVELVRLGLRAVLEGVQGTESALQAPRAPMDRTLDGPAGRESAPPHAVPGALTGRVAPPGAGTHGASRVAASHDTARPRRRTADAVAIEPDQVERGLVQLVLTVVELIRQVLERQALRRVEGGDLDDEDVERLGVALLRLEARMAELTHHFGIDDRALRLGLTASGVPA